MSDSEENNEELLKRIMQDKGISYNSKKLTSEKHKKRINSYVDTTDAYASQGKQLLFHHIPSNTSINFKAWITAFNETYSCDWAQETVFGRIDPIAMFKQTTRNVTLSFKVIAATASEAYENLFRVDTLRSFLYPSYSSTVNATTLSQSPLVRVKVMNLLTNAADGSTYSDLFGNGTMSNNPGAIAIIKNMSVAHNIENADIGSFSVGAGINHGYPSGVLPKVIEISMDFTIIHEKNMGWREGGSTLPPGVYGLDYATSLLGDAEPSPQATAADVDAADSTASQATKDGRIAQWLQTTALNIETRKSARDLQKAGFSKEGARKLASTVYSDQEAGFENNRSLLSSIAEDYEEMSDSGMEGFTEQAYLDIYGAN